MATRRTITSLVIFCICFFTYSFSIGKNATNFDSIGPVEIPGMSALRGAKYTIPFHYRARLKLPPFIGTHQLSGLKIDIEKKEKSLSPHRIDYAKKAANQKTRPLIDALHHAAPQQLKEEYKRLYPFTYEALEHSPETLKEYYMGKRKFLKELEHAKEFVFLWVYAKTLEEKDAKV